ncbi:MAG: hypothetical protein ABSE49_28495 [Polyangiaceae bacterium]
MPSPPPSRSPPPERGGAADHDAGERPTVVPAFDPEAFARDSEIKQRAAAPAGGEPTIDLARRHHLAGEHEEALFLLTRLLELAPLHPQASELASECRRALERDCLSAIGSESAVLALAVSPEELKRFALDNVSGFLLSVMDGATDVETILDISGLPRLLALRHLRSLLDRGIVAVVSRMKPR